jgi:hypothetical protein
MRDILALLCARGYVKEVASVLFSGGTDSTLAAVRALDEFERVELLTFDPGYVFFLGNSRVHARALAARYGADRVDHQIIDARDNVRRILFDDVGRDLATYDFSMTSLVCLGCRLAMHAGVIIHNLSRGIPYFVDGSVAQQANIPEQMRSTLDANGKFYFERFGITHRSPIYDEQHSDHRLYELGLSRQKNLKRQFILFDTQGTCAFGVPADVHSRLVYSTVQRDLRERESAAYREEKYALMIAYVDAQLRARGVELEPAVAALRRKRDLEAAEA